MSNFNDDTSVLALVIYYTRSNSDPRLVLLFGLSSHSGKPLPSPKEAVADPHQNVYYLVAGVLLCNCYQGLEGADPTWVQS